jgi:hypothetical protein
MIYLQRYITELDGSQAVDIAVVEDARHAERYEAQGYDRCTVEAFCQAWRLRDERSLAQLRAAMRAERQDAAPQQISNQRGIYQSLS